MITKDRLTQSSVFYAVRPLILAHGLVINPKNNYGRKYITNEIRHICKSLGTSREELGIIAAKRGEMYFRGNKFGVGIDEIEELAEKGTDIIIVEKEGIVEVLAPYAAEYGIALVYTRGFVQEYSAELSHLARKKGAHIAILVDFDISGVLIALTLYGVHKIGVDDETLSYLGITRKMVQEPYIPPKKHLKYLQKKYPDYPGLDFLNENRIEIDAVKTAVGAHRLWEFIISNLGKRFPTRDYNRAVKIYDYTEPKVLTRFNELVGEKASELTEQVNSRYRRELQQVHGFLNVDNKEGEISDAQLLAIREDPVLNHILAKLGELIDWLEVQ